MRGVNSLFDDSKGSQRETIHLIGWGAVAILEVSEFALALLVTLFSNTAESDVSLGGFWRTRDAAVFKGDTMFTPDE